MDKRNQTLFLTAVFVASGLFFTIQQKYASKKIASAEQSSLQPQSHEEPTVQSDETGANQPIQKPSSEVSVASTGPANSLGSFVSPRNMSELKNLYGAGWNAIGNEDQQIHSLTVSETQEP